VLAVIFEERKKVLNYLVIFFITKSKINFITILLQFILYSCNKFAYILSFYKNIKNENQNQK